MNSESERLIREATEGLRLRDIVLLKSLLFREHSPPEVGELDALQQHKRGVRFVVGEPKDRESLNRELQVVVSLGERVVEKTASETPNVYFGVEADYLVIYDMVADVSEDALKVFADFNSVHNVWPFWRQHVFDLVGQARLPTLEIPLFSGNGRGRIADSFSTE